MKKNHSIAKRIALVVALLFGGVAVATSADRKSYQNETITIKNVKRLGDSSVQIVYRTIAETMWYCPGADIKEIAEGLEVRFVRERLNKKKKVDHPGKVFGDGTKAWKVLTIPSKGEALYIRNGRKLVELLPKETK